MEATLERQVFDKKKFKETVDTTFSQLKKPVDNSFFDPNLATVGDFFTLYNKLFFEIPKSGEVNSHPFLIKESTDYVGFTSNNEEIQALLREIADLREENLNVRKDLINNGLGSNEDYQNLLIKSTSLEENNLRLQSELEQLSQSGSGVTIATLKGQIVDLREERDALKITSDALGIEKNRLKIDNDSLQNIITGLRQDNEYLQKELLKYTKKGV